MSAAAAKRILVVDDDEAVVEYLCESLCARGYQAKGIASATEALSVVQREDFDLVISDVEMPELRGVDLLAAILAAKPTQLVLLITAYASVEMAVAAVQAGACDFLTKPFKIEALFHSIERAFSERMLKREVVRLRVALAHSDSPRNVVARSGAMRRVLDVARRAARSKSSIFLVGETGTGKSLLARYIHEYSTQRDEPFLEINCAALPPTLVESELFGVRKGAFTDAREDREGLFVAARGGTLFLDEVGELSLEVQAKLLHALETGTVRPLGGTKYVPTRLRIIAATNRRPEELLREASFRPDLYYRISVVRIDVPPLRERRDDIVPLVDVLLARARTKNERPILGISAAAIQRLFKHSWPGNVRELANVIERAVAMTDHDIILPEDIDFPEALPTVPAEPSAVVDEELSLEEIERAHIQRVVRAQDGNKAAAARILGITRRTLYRKLGEA